MALLAIIENCKWQFYLSVNVVDGELLHITKVSRLHMAAYLCVASNGVPPSISKRVHLKVQCKWRFRLLMHGKSVDESDPDSGSRFYEAIKMANA